MGHRHHHYLCRTNSSGLLCRIAFRRWLARFSWYRQCYEHPCSISYLNHRTHPRIRSHYRRNREGINEFIALVSNLAMGSPPGKIYWTWYRSLNINIHWVQFRRHHHWTKRWKCQLCRVSLFHCRIDLYGIDLLKHRFIPFNRS